MLILWFEQGLSLTSSHIFWWLQSMDIFVNGNKYRVSQLFYVKMFLLFEQEWIIFTWINPTNYVKQVNWNESKKENCWFSNMENLKKGKQTRKQTSRFIFLHLWSRPNLQLFEIKIHFKIFVTTKTICDYNKNCVVWSNLSWTYFLFRSHRIG